MRWDLFCAVVDNFGDAGVCWRLARQLARDPKNHVRLYIDHAQTLHTMGVLESDPTAATTAGVEILGWPQSCSDIAVLGDVVVEAFGCQLPACVLDRMEEREIKSVWVNLEYLSAEPWVAEHHALPSPHPQRDLTKYFFFPGFTEGTGGLLREPGLAAAHSRFLASETERTALWARLGLEMPGDDEIRVTLFAYPHCAVKALMDACTAMSTHRWTFLVPHGVLPDLADDAYPRDGAIKIHRFAWVDQDAFDRILWASDFNFVRGEDSFVRAQWAELPVIWHIYAQDDRAHLTKLDAFVDQYLPSDPVAAEQLRALWHAWNEGDMAFANHWRQFFAQRHRWRKHAQQWSRSLSTQPDLVTQLTQFVEKVRISAVSG